MVGIGPANIFAEWTKLFDSLDSRTVFGCMTNASTRLTIVFKERDTSDHSKLVLDSVTGEDFFWFSGIETNFAVHLFLCKNRLGLKFISIFL
jgi:hypothetical protein